MKCLKCFAELKDSDWRCYRCGALTTSVPGVKGSPPRRRKLRALSDPNAIQQQGLRIFGCLGILLLIGLVLCAIILPWRVAQAWREAEDFREMRTSGATTPSIPVYHDLMQRQ